MNEKPQRLDMGFGEALARLARVPRAAVAPNRPKQGKKASEPKGKPAKGTKQAEAE